MPLVSGSATIEQLLFSMVSFPFSNLVQISAVGFFLNSSFSPSYYQLIVNENCLNAIINAMNFHPDHYHLQLWGSRLILWYGAQPQTKALAHSERVVELAIANLKGYSTSVELLSSAVALLMNVSAQPELQNLVSSQEFIDLIFSSLSTGPANMKLRQNLIGILFNLSNSIPLLKMLAIPELPPLINLLMDLHHDVLTFALWTSGLVANISSDPKGGNLFNTPESVDMMNVLATLHSTHSLIHRNVCGFFLNISKKNVFTAECILTVERAATLLPDDVVLRRWAFQYLYNFSFEQDFQAMATVGIAEFIWRGLSSYSAALGNSLRMVSKRGMRLPSDSGVYFSGSL